MGMLCWEGSHRCSAGTAEVPGSPALLTRHPALVYPCAQIILVPPDAFCYNDGKEPIQFYVFLANLATSPGKRQTRTCGKNCSHLYVLNLVADASVSGQDPPTSRDCVLVHLAFPC